MVLKFQISVSFTETVNKYKQILHAAVQIVLLLNCLTNICTPFHIKTLCIKLLFFFVYPINTQKDLTFSTNAATPKKHNFLHDLFFTPKSRYKKAWVDESYVAQNKAKTNKQAYPPPSGKIIRKNTLYKSTIGMIRFIVYFVTWIY